MRHVLIPAALGALLIGCAPRAASTSEVRAWSSTGLSPVAAEQLYFGPDRVEVDLVRPGEDFPRIFVQVTYPDGERGLFMVDTGAAVSTISQDVADRLELEVDKNWGMVEGLGGRTAMHRAEVSTLALGEAVLSDVEFAVGVRGVPERMGLMPLDGILGNNIWSRFVVEIDYPANLMVLHRPGTWKSPPVCGQRPRLRVPGPCSARMAFDGGHVLTPIEVVTDTRPPLRGSMLIQLDTGASALLLSGPSGLPFDTPADMDVFSEGVEPLLGIGAAETVPPHVFLQRTRRLPLGEVNIGGRRVRVEDLQAKWINFDGANAIGPQGLLGLAGHELMADHVAVFDYVGERFTLLNSRRRPRHVDAHRVLLDQDIERHGDDTERLLFRAEMHLALEEHEEAEGLLRRYVGWRESAEMDDEALKDAARGRVLLAYIRRHDGDLDGAWEAVAPLSPRQLVEVEELVAQVNGLLLEGREDEALALADAGIEAYEALRGSDRYEARYEGHARVARADALLFMERTDEAAVELLRAASLVENPDAHLLRRARVALASSDRHGSMAHVRRLLQLYPSSGPFLWFYGLLVEGDSADAETLRHDMEDAVGRLHAVHRPLDFMAAVYHLLGDQDRALEVMREGQDRDCDRPGHEQPVRDNCDAWYLAMAGVELDKAIHLIDRALDATGDRPDFLDTKAVVHLARGEHDQAARAAQAAARLSPDDLYMLWQAERMTQIAREEQRRQASGRLEAE